MSIVIHHGPPGSFKSSGVIQRVAIPALYEGRAVVTNVRGFDSVQTVEDAIGDPLPQSASIYYVDTETQAGRDHIAKFFHWAPLGALIIIDEAQDIYPVRRRDFRLESLDYPGGPDNATADNRPYDVLNAFDMHRHYNWDIYLCTTNIGKLHREIRESAEVAYRHWSMGELLPWKRGCWREVQHDPENNGKSKSHIYGSPCEYKIEPTTYKCYRSTKTGEHQQNTGVQSVFRDSRLRLMSFIAVICISLFCYFAVDVYEAHTTHQSGGSAVPAASGNNSSSPDRIPIGDAGPVSRPKIGPAADVVVADPWRDAELYIDGVVAGQYLIGGRDRRGEFGLTQREIEAHGYRVQHISSCVADIVAHGVLVRRLFCGRRYALASNASVINAESQIDE